MTDPSLGRIACMSCSAVRVIFLLIPIRNSKRNIGRVSAEMVPEAKFNLDCRS